MHERPRASATDELVRQLWLLTPPRRPRSAPPASQGTTWWTREPRPRPRLGRARGRGRRAAQ